jgi:hypothetical protein
VLTCKSFFGLSMIAMLFNKSASPEKSRKVSLNLKRGMLPWTSPRMIGTMPRPPSLVPAEVALAPKIERPTLMPALAPRSSYRKVIN